VIKHKHYDEITTESWTPKFQGYFICSNSLKLITIEYSTCKKTTSEFFYKGQIYSSPPYFDDYFKELNLKETRKYKLQKLLF
jgi:hypothetical protein